MKNIMDYTLDKLEDKLININEKKFRARQIFNWLYINKIYDFDKMNNLSKETIKTLKDNFKNDFIKIEKKQEGKDTFKYLFKLIDDSHIETVLMKHNYGNSICISSQVGCNMGCSFCESGKLKKLRNLEVYEMVQQVLLIEEDLDIRINSIVIMGIGEPFDNYDNVMDFIKIVNSDHGLKIGARHITVSTCGLIPGIKKFSDENLQVNLALSLHAPNDTLRSTIMKINNAYKINDLLDAVKEYIKKTNRRVTIEYVMLRDINDKDEHALELAKILKGLNVYVNLIPFNEVENNIYKKSSKERVLRFLDVLKKHKINVTIRREFGGEVDAACGQLRGRVK
ncbi:MAG TPA: 23S rRNA (adenine(2503)-C(2))-methyltransferase RlmN [Mollicutes bacterium]|nr:23S rRNA (adenine(2503)-C(2))-methyltransferase RlmN [Mollicutes bacterium]